MAQKRYCDRCGDEIEEFGGYHKIRLSQGTREPNADHYSQDTHDLCKPCGEQFRHWMKPPRDAIKVLA